MKTIYQPTEAELIEMGFTKNDMTHYEVWFLHAGPMEITYETSEKKKWWHTYGDQFYPTSKSEILTLIELFNQ